MKKISLLFASIVIVSFTANAQEPVKVKAKQEPVRVSPVEQPIKGEKVTVAETTPHSDIQPTTKPVTRVEKVETGEVKTNAPQVKRTTNVKKHPIVPKKAAAVSVMKAGEAK